MTQIELNTELSSYLILVLLNSDLALVHDFHTTYKTCLFMLNKHNLAKLSLPHLFTNLKIGFLYLSRGRNIAKVVCLLRGRLLSRKRFNRLS